ncbi:arginase [Scheffersomyces coipomensis]|uniref:arginase n=1 Tax=Scheffersomyces coipomensis TaxID=1788519 RepID=UPI00315D7D1A
MMNFIEEDIELSEYDKQFQFHHSQYLSLQSTLKLPHDNFVDDIVLDQNIFGGILTYAHFPHFNCFNPDNYNKEKIDIAILGAPFDTGVSYRPGARFGPEAIRSNSRRLMKGVKTSKKKAYPRNPYDSSTHNYTIIDCGDVPLTPFDNRLALNQLYRGQNSIHTNYKSDNGNIPKIITLGGDHTITLMPLKSISNHLNQAITIFHFDSHIDTWNPKILGGGISNYMSLNHGTFLHYAHEKGYIATEGNYHIGMRAPLIDEVYDHEHDLECGFNVITADDIDKIGIDGIIRKLKSSIKHDNDPIYISVDIDVLDPAYAPATGTMEVGGFTTRELLSILNGLKGINLVGADIVEVSPPFDTNSEITSLAATAIIDSFLKLMIN